jgi:hypothetical protein
MQGMIVPVADDMRVELRSQESGAFKIDPEQPVTKHLELGGHAEWHWKVTALLPGSEHLILHSQRIPHKSNGDELAPIDDDSRVATITVMVILKREIFKKGAVELFKEDWKKIAGAIGAGIAAVVAAWWKVWWGKRHPKESSKFEDLV